jgi:hypothetical protein
VASIAWADIRDAAGDLPVRCDFIFHISHVGSTLLSRLLGEHPAYFSLREPAILRRLALGEFAERWPVFLGLWSRTFAPDQKAIIKATSFVNSIAENLMAQVHGSRALLMYVPARTFITALLDGVMSDIDDLAEMRLKRLQQRDLLADVSLDNLSPGQRVAMSWLAEMTSLQETAERFPQRTLWLNFDQFLSHSAVQLARVFEHFDIDGDSSSLLAHPLMSRYAKRPDVRYDASFRQQLLERAGALHTVEIAAGLAWLQTALRQLEPRQAGVLRSLDER